jgi:hypothetical protein
MRKGVLLWAKKACRESIMSKKNNTNRVMTVLSSVMAHRGKSELEICIRKKRGLKVNFFLIGIILALLPIVSSASYRSIIVRDRSGNTVETKDWYGDDTIVRDRSGSITRTEHYDGQGQKTIRDREGNIIGTEERD